jgi:hypothetical protein
MQNIVSSFNMETRLKKWRSAMEAIISNIKGGSIFLPVIGKAGFTSRRKSFGVFWHITSG